MPALRRHLAVLPLAALAGAAALVLAPLPGAAQDGRSDGPPASREADGRPAPGQADPSAMGGRLIEALRRTPGCLGVDAAEMMSGRMSILAWFENKAAAVRWYESPVHQGMMQTFFPGYDPSRSTPLEHVTDEQMPILVIATMTPNRTPKPGGGPSSAFAQISIELYAPLPGGAHMGGRLAPETFPVPHMKSAPTGRPGG